MCAVIFPTSVTEAGRYLPGPPVVGYAVGAVGVLMVILAMLMGKKRK